MSDNRLVAEKLLVTATRTIMKDRPGIHGSAEMSFEMIAELWTVYIRHIRRVHERDDLNAVDVAEMMTLLKKARKVYGDPTNEDNDVDDIGYAALAGMLRLPDPKIPSRPSLPAADSVPREKLVLNEEQFLKDLNLNQKLKAEQPVEDKPGIMRSPGQLLQSIYGLNTKEGE